VREALESVIGQSYTNIQLIAVDDASTDDSRDVISAFASEHPGVVFVANSTNQGNCKAFNSGLALARGAFVIDLSADDVLVPERVETGVAEFEKRDAAFGVQFGDAMLINEDGGFAGYHSDRFPPASVPQGDIYAALIWRYFVCGPTTMVRKRVLDELGGYDEQLAYEDFDFWIRSSRQYKYFYTQKVLVKRRLVRGALNEKQFITRSSHARSTFEVCRKILGLNRTRSEQSALSARIFYELKQSIIRRDAGLFIRYAALLIRNLSWKPART
jgi:glycosyltransferase involved in cell wall biosynthesis